MLAQKPCNTGLFYLQHGLGRNNSVSKIQSAIKRQYAKVWKKKQSKAVRLMLKPSR